MRHLVLLGDSVFDNAAYVDPGQPGVAEQVRSQVPGRPEVTLLATDGHYVSDVLQQMERLPGSATHLFLSVGGNDAQNAQSEKAGLVLEDVAEGEEEGGALSPELRDLAGKAVGYHESALWENTREAYQRGWEDFLSFCQTHCLDATPATERAVALYPTGRTEEVAPSNLLQHISLG